MSELDALSERLTQMADSLTDEGLKGVLTEVGVAAKGTITDAAKVDLGGDARFSGWRRAGVLGSGFEHEQRGVIVITPRAEGPWTVAEKGRWPGRKYSRKRRRVVGWGSTRPKHTWTDAVRDLDREVPDTLDTEFKALFKRLR